MNQRRVFAQRLIDRKRSAQRFVIALDEFDRLVGGGFVDCDNRSDDIADVTLSIAGKKLFVLNAEPETLRRRLVGG
jgi:hypothetical protein